MPFSAHREAEAEAHTRLGQSCERLSPWTSPGRKGPAWYARCVADLIGTRSRARAGDSFVVHTHGAISALVLEALQVLCLCLPPKLTADCLLRCLLLTCCVLAACCLLLTAYCAAGVLARSPCGRGPWHTHGGDVRRARRALLPRDAACHPGARAKRSRPSGEWGSGAHRGRSGRA